MAITDKTRKILWGRSGNRCAICRQSLVVSETSVDSESVVGDECHINSGVPKGPRYNLEMNPQNIDDISNLLLLCRVHHKMVDDQFETYTTDILKAIKANHEQWIESKFKEEKELKPVRIKRFKSEIPSQLKRIESGQELFNLLSTCHGSYQNHTDNLSDEEVEIVGDFLQSLTDWIDIASDLETIDQVRAKSSLNCELKELKNHGFLLFAAREKQRLEGGIGQPSNFFVLHLSVVREEDERIVKAK